MFFLRTKTKPLFHLLYCAKACYKFMRPNSVTQHL